MRRQAWPVTTTTCSSRAKKPRICACNARRQFEHVLKEAGLKLDKQGRVRTLYSLRHTALMFRLLKGDKIDIFKLAHNALTSVDQLERFYLSHTQSRMIIKELQSSAPSAVRLGSVARWSMRLPEGRRSARTCDSAH